MKRILTPLALAAFAATGTAATAEQYIVTLSGPIAEDHAAVLETLKISVVEAFDYEGARIVVLDAPGEAYLETLFNVIDIDALSVGTLPVDWTDDAMAQIDTASRLKFGTMMDCGFCTS